MLPSVSAALSWVGAPLLVVGLALPTATGRWSGGAGVRSGPTSAEIDAEVWSAVSASVEAADIVAMARTYHPAAVLVNEEGTKSIAAALREWGEGMVAAKRDGIRATVAFRFSKRLDDSTTAFETGVFRYATVDRAGVTTAAHVRFEALLVKSNGRWQTLMERQLPGDAEDAWNALLR